MGDWYSVGMSAGLGVALGVLATGVLAGRRFGLPLALVLAVAAGIALGLALGDAEEVAGGGVGAIAGGVGSAELVRRALSQGGGRLATGLLVAIGAVILAALAFVPVLGYVEAVALPALGARLRRRGPRRYAGLRSLARD